MTNSIRLWLVYDATGRFIAMRRVEAIARMLMPAGGSIECEWIPEA